MSAYLSFVNFGGTSRIWFWLMLAILATLGESRGQDKVSTGWNPTRTWVLSIDVLLYEGDREEDIPKSWLEIPASRLVEQFRAIGVPAEQIVVLQRGESSVANVEKRFAQLMQQTQPGDRFVFYFSGHSGRDTLSLHDKSVQKSWLIEAIEAQFRGNEALLFIDSCYSGGVAELVRKERTRVSYAVLTSTFAQQTARSGCRFYQCLLRGLSGNPVVDLDGDGFVTFNELSDYTTKYMAFAAEGKPTSVTTGQFDSEFRLAESTGKAASGVGELVEVWFNEKWQKAEILENTPSGPRIHFTRNTVPDDDQVVPRNSLRKPQFKSFKNGQRVEVYSGVTDRWHHGTVIERFESLHFCQLDGLPPTNNEWFGPTRIREGNEPRELRELRRWQGVFQGPNGWKLTIDDDDWSFTTNDPNTAASGTFMNLEITNQWTQADLIVEAGTEKGKTIKAIFRLEGDTLRYCGTLTGKRPTEFVESGANDQIFVAWKRVKR